jgi:hypothetical protein
MRSLLTALLLVFVVSSFASAELLTTASPLGQGKWGVMASGLQDSSQQGSGLTGLTVTSFGGSVGYGVIDKLDLYLSAGTGSVSGFPATIATISTAGIASTITAYGLIAKYSILDETANSPVSVAVEAGYKSIATSNTAPTSPWLGGGAVTNSNSTQIMARVNVSKIMAPFVPYGGLAYRSTSGDTTSTQLDLTVGSAIAWSTQGAVFAEYTLQSITPNGGTNFSSGQIALSVGYAI